LIRRIRSNPNKSTASSGEAIKKIARQEGSAFASEQSAQPFRILTDGTRSPTYYAIESVGIATGMLVTAVHSCGLVSLTHTPSPMGFLNRILGRPSHEKPFVLLVVGHPAENALVPDIGRKSLAEISSFDRQSD
jgi:hypothetical protein